MECDYTLSSISNNGSFVNYPMINKKQILLDWINTINEPQCLLVSELDDLKDGKVFVEILRHFLYMHNNKKYLNELFKCDRGNPFQKLQIIIEILLKITEGDDKSIISRFYKIYTKIYTDDDMLLEFLSVLRGIYEKDNLSQESELSTSGYKVNENYISSNENYIQEDTADRMNYNSYIVDKPNSSMSTRQKGFDFSGSDYASNSFTRGNFNTNATNNTTNFNTTNFKTKNNSNNSNNEFNMGSSSERKTRYNFNKDFINAKPKLFPNFGMTYENSEVNKNVFTQSNNTNTTERDANTYIEAYKEKKPEKSKQIRLTKQTQNQNFYPTPRTEKNTEMSITTCNNLNITPTKKKPQVKQPTYSKPSVNRKPSYNINRSNLSFLTNDNSFSIANDVNKMYGKKHKASLNMSRGIQSINKLYAVDFGNFKLKYAKFFRPTEPVIEVCYTNIKKYHVITRGVDTNPVIEKPKRMSQLTPTKQNPPSLSFTPSNSNISKENNYKTNSNVQTTTKKSPVKPKIQKEVRETSPMKTNDELLSYYTTPEEDDSGVPESVKSKVYYWLVDLGIIKEKVLHMDALPKICINGVLLCDLVNRCEGRNEAIKGIIRKTTTKSQIQVNINKVLDYLRSNEKFSSRHLWSNDEIARGNKKVIWELLEDICNFYSKQRGTFKRSKSKPSMMLSNQKPSIKKNNSSSNIRPANRNFQSPKEKIFQESNITCQNTGRELSIDNISNINSNTNTYTNTNTINTAFPTSANDRQEMYSHTNYFLSTNSNNTNRINHITNQEDDKMFCLDEQVKKKTRNSGKSPFPNQIPKPQVKGGFKRVQSEDRLIKTAQKHKKESSLTSNNFHNLTTMNNQSALSSKPNNSCFILFEKNTAKRMKAELGKIQYDDISSNNLFNNSPSIFENMNY